MKYIGGYEKVICNHCTIDWFWGLWETRTKVSTTKSDFAPCSQLAIQFSLLARLLGGGEGISLCWHGNTFNTVSSAFWYDFHSKGPPIFGFTWLNLCYDIVCLKLILTEIHYYNWLLKIIYLYWKNHFFAAKPVFGEMICVLLLIYIVPLISCLPRCKYWGLL